MPDRRLDARKRGPKGPDEYVLMRGKAEPDGFPVTYPTVRTWLPKIGPTAAWLLLELQPAAWHGDEPETLQAEQVAQRLGVKQAVVWNAMQRLARYRLVQISPDETTIVVHGTISTPLMATMPEELR